MWVNFLTVFPQEAWTWYVVPGVSLWRFRHIYTPPLYQRGWVCQGDYDSPYEVHDVRRLFPSSNPHVYRLTPPECFPTRSLGFKTSYLYPPYKVWSINCDYWSDEGEGWLPLVMQPGFTSLSVFHAPSVRKRGTTVEFRGFVSAVGGVVGQSAFSVPAGFITGTRITTFPMSYGVSANMLGRLDFIPDGNAYVITGYPSFWLDGIKYEVYPT